MATLSSVADMTLQSTSDTGTESLMKLVTVLETDSAVTRNLGAVLHSALESKASEGIISFLLDRGADVNALNCHGETPFIVAADKRTLQQLLSRGADVNAESNYGRTQLLNAVESNNLEIVEWLIQTGIDINKQNRRHLTPLKQALVSHRNEDMVRLLVENGACVNFHSPLEPPLFHECFRPMMASEKKCVDIMTVLICWGADINAPNLQGETPLMVVAKKKRLSLMQCLLASGANVNAITCTGKYSSTSVLSMTLESNYDGKMTRCLEMLLNYGARLPSSCMSITVALGFHRLIAHGSVDLIFRLVRRGITPSTVGLRHLLSHAENYITSYKLSNMYSSPLCTALLYGELKVAVFFLENWFLVKSDLSLNSDADILSVLSLTGKKKSLTFLQNVASQPWSLSLMSFMSLSETLGFHSGREERIEALPAPPKIKKKLLFKI